MIHPEEKSDADLLSYWQQSVDAALAQPVGNPRQTSLHITAGELARLVAMAEKWLSICARFTMVATGPETVMITINEPTRHQGVGSYNKLAPDDPHIVRVKLDDYPIGDDQ